MPNGPAVTIDAVVVAAIEGFTPTGVDEVAARFARTVTMAARPASVARARAFLFATSRLGAFGARSGLEVSEEILLHPSVIERFCLRGTGSLCDATARTLRTNLRAVAAALAPAVAPRPPMPRERAKSPYSEKEIAAYLALADAQGTKDRRWRASALVCLGAGAGLTGADLRDVRGTDVKAGHGGLLVGVGGRRPRRVPVLARYHDRLRASAVRAGSGFLIGGNARDRRNVTAPLTASLAGGCDLPRLELGRLRATWLCTCAETIGLATFMDVAGITCSQRLGDLVSVLARGTDETAIALLGGVR